MASKTLGSKAGALDDIRNHLNEHYSVAASWSDGTSPEEADALIQQGEMSRRWVLNALGNPDQSWYLLRNALMILRFVGKGREGIDRARSFISHAHPRVRDEALLTGPEAAALFDGGPEIVAAVVSGGRTRAWVDAESIGASDARFAFEFD